MNISKMNGESVAALMQKKMPSNTPQRKKTWRPEGGVEDILSPNIPTTLQCCELSACCLKMAGVGASNGSGGASGVASENARRCAQISSTIEFVPVAELAVQRAPPLAIRGRGEISAKEPWVQ